MKTLVIFTSQTGFTKKYAEWIAERTGADIFDSKAVMKKDNSFFDEYEAIVYAGWIMAEKVAKVNWFLGKAKDWKNKKLAIVAVGAGPADSPQAQQAVQKILTDEQKSYIDTFYCQGGLNYEKMNVAARLTMQAFTHSLKKSKNEESRKMGGFLDHSFDSSDHKYIEPVVAFLQKAMSA